MFGSRTMDTPTSSGSRFLSPSKRTLETESLLARAWSSQSIQLLALLLARVIKTEHIREKSDYLLGNLPFFFIPASVSIINYADVLRENLLALVVVCAVSLIATFAATVGAVRLTCRLLERGKRR